MPLRLINIWQLKRLILWGPLCYPWLTFTAVPGFLIIWLVLAVVGSDCYRLWYRPHAACNYTIYIHILHSRPWVSVILRFYSIFQNYYSITNQPTKRRDIKEQREGTREGGNTNREKICKRESLPIYICVMLLLQ